MSAYSENNLENCERALTEIRTTKTMLAKYMDIMNSDSELQIQPPPKARSRLGTRDSPASSTPSEELIEEYKNLIQDRERKQIILLCTDLTDKANSKHVVDSAVALRNQGHRVTILTTAFKENLYIESMTKIGVVEVGSWIPTSMRGYFPHLFYFIRSLYSTFYMIYAFRNLQPKVSVVFCQTNYIVLPIIQCFTNYKIIYFQYEFELSKYRMPAPQITYEGSWFATKCLQSADKILVPNKVFYDIYLRSFKSRIIPHICEPYLNVRELKKEKLLPLNQVLEDIKENTMIFLILAEYHPRSNLELALDSFHLLLHAIDHAGHHRLRLVIAGHAGKGRTNYVRRLAGRIRRLHLDQRVLLQPKPSRQHKKALLAGCAALLSCQEHGLWDRYVLEAMALGRPIIAADSGFTSEVLEHGVTGYVIPATHEHFAAAMQDVLSHEGKGDFLGKMAHCEFLKRYSIESFGARLAHILQSCSSQDKNRRQDQIANAELFFGRQWQWHEPLTLLSARAPLRPRVKLCVGDLCNKRGESYC